MTKSSMLPVILSACGLLMLSFGFRAGFGLFVGPISAANEWGRDIMSLALAVQNLAWGIGAVFAGGIADKFGNLRVMLAGVALYVSGMALMAYSSTPLTIIMTAGVLVGLGIACTAFGIVLPAMARAVPPEKQSWALGLGTAAGSFGQFIVVPIIGQTLVWLDWAMAIQVLAALALVMAFLAIPLSPYGGPQKQAANTGTHIADQQLSKVFGQAWSFTSYRLLVAGFFVCGFHVAFITVHMPGYLLDLGFDTRVAAWSISLIGLCNVVGAYVSGILSNKGSKKNILAGIYLGRAVVIALFLVTPISLASVLLFSAAMGFLWLATIPPTSGLVVVFFGTRYMAFLYGIVFLSHQVGSFSGVWLGGVLYEIYGNYNGIWIAGIVLGLAAAAVHWPITERPESVDWQPVASR